MTQPRHLSAVWALPFLWALPAQALDCGKATAPLDKAICANPAAADADASMSAAYTLLYDSAPDAKKKQIQQSQRAWLKQRAASCIDDKKVSATCLVDWTHRRAAFLQGKPESGPGTGHDLTPLIVMQSATPKLYEEDIAVLNFAAPSLPGEKTFNAEVEKLMKDAPQGKEDEDEPDMTYSYDLHLRVTYASPKFLSAAFETYLFSGGAHGNSGTGGINIDVAKGTNLTFADAFQPQAHQKLKELCLAQIKTQKHEKMPDEKIDAESLKQVRDTIRDDIGKFDRWYFQATKAVVNFDPYELGAYVEGAYSCEFPLDALRPLYRPGSVLP